MPNISAMIGGYGSGKTIAGSYKAFKNLIKHRGKRGFIGNIKSSILKKTTLDEFYKRLDENNINYTERTKQKRIITDLGEVSFETYNNYEEIVGENFAWAWLDELDVSRYSDKVWEKIISRMRGARDIELFATTTPEGFSTSYRIFSENSKDRMKNAQYIRADSRQNPFLPQMYIENMMDLYTKEFLEAYLKGRWVNLNTGKVYKNFTRAKNVAKKIVPRYGNQLFIGMDFNVNPMTSVIGIRANGNLYIIDEFYLRNSDTEQMCIEIKQEYPDYQYIFFPDATGSRRTTSSKMGRTDITILKRFGKVRVESSNPPVRDRINVVNFILGKDKEHRRLYIDKSCEKLTKDLEQVSYDDNGNIDKKTNPDLTHISDALGYLAWGIYKHDYKSLTLERREYAK